MGTGPRIFVVIDDYDLVTTGTGCPPVPPELRRGLAGDVRAVTQRVRQLDAQGVVLSGDPAEGDLIGAAHGRPVPTGRGCFATRRGGGRLVRTALLPERS
ncbi:MULTISPECIES: hypothetical protein [unclassified Streptomyces]|uniref:hypothetical protein n=1 Tax=unclassified Streptomyces TaxID=2593676 RepID=UPI000374B702|nr:MULTISPECIES: hypothetical protein [unclassified Streptomyces]MYY05491.1 hypothetical protein [Streptomyces sp. SID4913]